jgi:Uma2 family endonuclease
MTALVLSTDAPAVPGPRQGQWTCADWEGLPDDGNRYEVIDGVLYMTTAPSSFHQWIVNRLVRYIAIPAEDQDLAFAFTAPIGVIMPGCDPVQPDFVVVLASRTSILREGRIMGAPDLIVEILSPSNKVYDQEVKLEAYARAGVPEYAIVDPIARTLSHYRLKVSGRYASPHVSGEAEVARFDCLPTISVPVGDLFAGAPDTTLRAHRIPPGKDT